MTLRKSILLSFALHLLLIGTGITFARFAGDLLRGRHDPIMVALIGREGTSTSASEAKTAAPRPREIKRTVPSKDVLPEQAPVQQETQSPAAALQQQTDRQQGEGTTAPQQSQQQASGLNGESAAAASAPAGSESGSVSSEQWAVIVSSIERAKNYPRLARERGIQGVVRLRFRVKPQGNVERVEIVRSSGSDILDTASVNTLYHAGPMPYVNGWVEVPIAYVLR
jgi:periplasmic protein TonB